MNTPFMNTREAAEYLRISHRTLEKKRADGTGPQYKKLGRRVVYEREEVAEWATAQTRRSTSDPGPTDPAKAK